MAYAADDFAYIAKRLEEIRACIVPPNHDGLSDGREVTHQQGPGVISENVRYRSTTTRSGLLSPNGRVP